VADSGRYVVTFDEWGRVGYGPNVVVIYGPDGEVIKKYALEGLLTEEEISQVTHGVSSRWWRDSGCLNEYTGVLNLRVVLGYEPYSPLDPEPYAVIREKAVTISIRLSDGEVLP
jgi:hypothetical protein